MPHRKSRPPDEFDGWTKKVQSLIDEMSNRIFFEFRPTRAWQPRVNVYSTARGLVLCVELAGLEASEVTLEALTATRIRLGGVRERPGHADLVTPCCMEVMEIDEGRFERDVELPEAVNVGGAQVSYDRGFLWIFLPRGEPT